MTIYIGLKVLSMSCNYNTYPLNKDLYQLIALDMDGTLLRRDKTISPRTKAVLKALQDKDLKLVIETGRCPCGVMRYADTIGLDLDRTYAVCYNGSGVFTLGDGKELSAVTKPGRILKEIAELAHAHGAYIHAYSQDRALLVENHNPYSQKEIEHSLSPFVEVDFAEIPDDEPIYKVIAVGEAEKLDAVRAACPEHLKEHFAVMRTDSYFLEFIAGRSTKGSGLLQLCDILKLKPEQAIAIGDAENDEQMVKLAGLGVAMGNATAELKAIAAVETLSCDEDGVAVFLERLL